MDSCLFLASFNNTSITSSSVKSVFSPLPLFSISLLCKDDKISLKVLVSRGKLFLRAPFRSTRSCSLRVIYILVTPIWRVFWFLFFLPLDEGPRAFFSILNLGDRENAFFSLRAKHRFFEFFY